MIEMLGMAILPSAADIVNEIIKDALKESAKSAGAYIMQKLLPMKCEHPACKEIFETQICNHNHNDIECPNCHKIIRQFTNVCRFTLKNTGQIAHIGIRFGEHFHHHDDINQIHVPGEYLFVGLRGQTIVEQNFLRKFGEHQIFSVDNHIWTPKSDFDLRSMWLVGHSERIPEAVTKSPVILNLDTELRSKYDDILATDTDAFRW